MGACSSSMAASGTRSAPVADSSEVAQKPSPISRSKGKSMADAGAVVAVQALKKQLLRSAEQPVESIVIPGNTFQIPEAKLSLIELLDAISRCTTLLTLDCSYNVFTEEQILTFSSAVSTNVSLNELILRNCQFANSAAPLVDTLKQKNSIQKMDLSGNALAEAGVAVLLPWLLETTALVSLNLSDCDLNDQAISALVEGLLLSKTPLQELNLENNPFSDEGAEALLHLVLNRRDLELQLGSISLGMLWKDLPPEVISLENDHVIHYMRSVHSSIAQEEEEVDDEVSEVAPLKEDLFEQMQKQHREEIQAQRPKELNTDSPPTSIPRSITVAWGANGIQSAYSPRVKQNREMLLSRRRYSVEPNRSVPVETVFRLKLMFVGYGGMGKTTLQRVLRGLEFNDREMMTHGLWIHNWVSESATTPGRRYQFSCWDFAGQREYYSTHQLFLSDRCVYLLLWNPRFMQDDPDKALRFWLKSISSFPRLTDNSGLSVLIVCTCKDDETLGNGGWLALQQIVPGLKEEFPTISIETWYVGCGNNDSIPELRNRLYELCEQSGKLEMREAWAKFSRSIEEKRDSLQGLQTQADLVELGRTCRLTTPDAETALEIFHNWGLLLKYSIRNTDLCVLQPQWLANVLFAIVNPRLARAPGDTSQEAIDSRALVPRADLELLLQKQQVQVKDVESLVTMLKKFKVAFELNENMLLIPARLESKPTPEQRAMAKSIISTKLASISPEMLQVVEQEFTLTFLPADFLQNLCYHTHQFIVQHESQLHHCWGTYMLLSKNNQYAEIELSPTDAQPFSITFRVQGTAPNNLCNVVADTILRLVNKYPNVSASQLIVCSGCAKKNGANRNANRFAVAELTSMRAQGEQTKKCWSCQTTHMIDDLLQVAGYRVVEHAHIRASTSKEMLRKGSSNLNIPMHMLDVLRCLHKNGNVATNNNASEKGENNNNSNGMWTSLIPTTPRAVSDPNITTVITLIQGLYAEMGELRTAMYTLVDTIETKFTTLRGDFETRWDTIKPAESRDLEQVQENREDFQRQVLNMLTLLDKRCQAMPKAMLQVSENKVPRMFVLQPKDNPGWRDHIDPRGLFKKKFLMNLLCEYPGEFHMQPNEEPYVVEFTEKKWRFVAAATSFLLKAASVVFSRVPKFAIKALDQYANDPMMNFKSTRADADASAQSSNPKANVMVREAEGLRELVVLLESLDPVRRFQGLSPVESLTGDIIWCCKDHRRLLEMSRQEAQLHHKSNDKRCCVDTDETMLKHFEIDSAATKEQETRSKCTVM